MAYPYTPALDLPFETYRVNSYRFGEDCTYNTVHWGIHLAEDCSISAKTLVRAIGRGTVVYSALHRGSREKRNWGGIIIVAHKHPATRNVFFSLYGHLGTRKVQKGERVSHGQVIGAVGKANTPENGWWEDAHLHLSIYTGPWLGKALPGYYRKDQKLTKLEWWHAPTPFIRGYRT